MFVNLLVVRNVTNWKSDFMSSKQMVNPSKPRRIFPFFIFYVVKLTVACSVFGHEFEVLTFINVIISFHDGLVLDTTQKLDIVSNSMIISLEILLVGVQWLNLVPNY